MRWKPATLSQPNPAHTRNLSAFQAMNTQRCYPIRDKANPWVCSVWFLGTPSPVFLKGNAGPSSPVPLLFVAEPKEAMSATYKDWFTFAWPHLILSHAVAIGRRPAAVVHRLKDAPDWSGTAAGLPEWVASTGL